MPTWPSAISAARALKSSRSCSPAADWPRSPSHTSMRSGCQPRSSARWTSALCELTVEMLPHLFRTRLSNVDHRLTVKMSWGDFDLAQTEIGGHGLPPQFGVGSADEPSTVVPHG